MGGIPLRWNPDCHLRCDMWRKGCLSRYRHWWTHRWYHRLGYKHGGRGGGWGVERSGEAVGWRVNSDQRVDLNRSVDLHGRVSLHGKVNLHRKVTLSKIPGWERYQAEEWGGWCEEWPHWCGWCGGWFHGCGWWCGGWPHRCCDVQSGVVPSCGGLFWWICDLNKRGSTNDC